MSDQQLNFLQEEDSICRSMLLLSTSADHHPTSSIPYKPTSDSPDKYAATTYTNSAKRQSPSSFHEPSSKRATLRPPSPSSFTAADDTHHLLGFTKLPLPHSFPTASPPSHLRRTLSDSIQYTEPINSEAPPPQFSELPTYSRPVLNQNTVQESIPIPNAQPLIYRTVSDPSPVLNCQVAAAGGTPPLPTQTRNVHRSPSCGESPSKKRLKRMKERMREMSQWWNQVVREGEDEDFGESVKYASNNISKEECEREMENSSEEEAVWVEKNGDFLVLHFKCPCGDGYQILLSGNNCYYKLTSF